MSKTKKDSQYNINRRTEDDDGKGYGYRDQYVQRKRERKFNSILRSNNIDEILDLEDEDFI